MMVVDDKWPFPELAVKVNPADTALMIIDMQYHDAHRDFGYAGAMGKDAPGLPDYYFDRIEDLVMPSIAALLDAFRSANSRVVHVTVGAELDDLSDISATARSRSEQRLSTVGRPSWYPRSSFEHQMLPGLEPQPGELVINKTTIGTFNSTNLERILRNMKIDSLVIVGVNTTVCVETTARNAVDLGFNVVLVDDACAGVDAESHAATMRAFRRHFGRVAVVSDILAELAQPVVAS